MSAAFSAAVVVMFVKQSHAEDAVSCSSAVTRVNVVACALRSSLTLRSEQQGKEVLEGRREAVSPLLPSNPILSVTTGQRTASTGDPTAWNWYATLSQEVEVAGQRGARRDAVDASIAAQNKRIIVVRRQVALEAWIAFFEVSAAQNEKVLTDSLSSIVTSISTVARAKANEGVLSPLDADVAEATSLRIARARFGAERRVILTRAALASLLGLDPTPGTLIQSDLTPIPGVDVAARNLAQQAVANRPELEAANAERRAQAFRADVFRRARIPNPNLSIFVHNDGFNERVLGAGIAFPIPLPSPVGRTYAGEISEAEASARRAHTHGERIQREIRLEVASALAAYESKQRELQGFTPDRLRKAEATLRLLSQEIQAGRLNVRDALLAQQALVELLQANLAAQRDLALASVDVARAVGMPLEGGAQ